MGVDEAIGESGMNVGVVSVRVQLPTAYARAKKAAERCDL